MIRFVAVYRHWTLAACLVAPLLGAVRAEADSTLACSTLSANAAETPGPRGLEILKTEALYRFQPRPYLRIPEGVALWVRAPRGVTPADLHNQVRECAQRAPDTRSPLCVQGASLRIDRDGGSYVVRVTSQDPTTAREIQRRALPR